jgi:hypothetical protein
MNPDGTAITQPDWITGTYISLAFGLFLLFVVLPVVGLTVLSLLDVLFRVDIGTSKLLWAPVLMLQGVGLAMYWLLRPTEYQPLLDTGGTSFSVTYVEPPTVYASPSRSPAVASRATEDDEPAQELPKVA